MSVRRMLCFFVAALLLICCFGGVVESGMWPTVRESSVCGKYESLSGGVVHLRDNGVAEVSSVTFVDFMGEGDRELSGLGEWRFERGVFAPAEIALGVDRFSFSLYVKPGWLGGEIKLWHFTGDPDSGERESFLRISDCVS